LATDKRQFTMRMQDETFEKLRYLAFIDRRSITMEVEHIILQYIAEFEKTNGEIQISLDK